MFTCFNRKSLHTLLRLHNQVGLSNRADAPSYIFPHNYSLNEEQAILEKLNGCDNNELCKFSITAGRSKRLLAHRKKYGEFKSLHQVLAVEGFGVKILKVLCNNILNPTPENETAVCRRWKNYNFVFPEITTQKQKMRHVVGVNLGSLSISWAGFDLADAKIFCWGQHDLVLSPDIKRHHEVQILEAAYDACKHLPEADTYVMESSVTSSSSQKPNALFNQQRLQMSSMLLVLLNQAARDRNEQQCVIYQKNALWCRLYGTLIGTERVSTQKMIEDMVSGTPGPYSPFQIPVDLLEIYYSSKPVVQEAMGVALLLTTSFIDINVRCLPECLSILRGRKKTKY